MRIKFTGYMSVAPQDVPDDAGSIDHWLVGFLKDSTEHAVNSDEAFELLSLQWEIVKES